MGDTIFFKKDISSAKIVFGLIDSFSKFVGFRPNVSKCELAGIYVLKNVDLALCSMKTAYLTKETIKMLGVQICYNKKF